MDGARNPTVRTNSNEHCTKAVPQVIRKRATIEKWIEDLEHVYTTNRK